MLNTFTILTVCTGNICRSPLAEQLLALELSNVPEVQVASAGTHALVGHGMPEQSLAIALAHNVPNPSEHASRQLTEEILAESDLILAMSREHRRAIVELNPRVSKRVFTIREFARLAQETSEDDLRSEFAPGPFGGPVSLAPADRMRTAVGAVGAGRGMQPPLADPTQDDVVDPYKQSQEIYKQSTSELVPAVQKTVQLLKQALELEV